MKVTLIRTIRKIQNFNFWDMVVVNNFLTRELWVLQSLFLIKYYLILFNFSASVINVNFVGLEYLILNDINVGSSHRIRFLEQYPIHINGGTTIKGIIDKENFRETQILN